MKRSTLIKIVILLTILVVAWLALIHRVRIEAWIWHLRHGQSDVFAKYVVPVPTTWFVVDKDKEEESLTLIRLDTEDRTGQPKRDRKVRFHTIITLFTHPIFKPGQLDFITSVRSSELKKEGIEPMLRTFNFDSEVLSCAGGGRLAHVLQAQGFYESDPSVWECWSSGWLALTIMSTDADMEDAWKIVSQIRKKP